MADPAFQHLRCRWEQGVLVITLTEKQMQGDELADKVRRELFEAVDHFQANKLVLEFQEVKYLGSAGFRPLLSLLRKLRETGGAMVFCHLNPDVTSVFEVTRLITTSRSMPAPFEAAPTLKEAIQRLQGPAGTPA